MKTRMGPMIGAVILAAVDIAREIAEHTVMATILAAQEDAVATARGRLKKARASARESAGVVETAHVRHRELEARCAKAVKEGGDAERRMGEVMDAEAQLEALKTANEEAIHEREQAEQGLGTKLDEQIAAREQMEAMRRRIGQSRVEAEGEDEEELREHASTETPHAARHREIAERLERMRADG